MDETMTGDEQKVSHVLWTPSFMFNVARALRVDIVLPAE
ncbi:hypothetical protein B4113_1655 [Geobacillus sp. B4113_201601]|nr:hypothetical protein B4113_1655 [Geobacillus sp. B4113_201601]